MADISRQLGKRIQELRKAKGLTQSELAEMVNTEIVSISRIENGQRFPKKENIENIASALKTDVKDLFDFEHHKTQEDLEKNIQIMIKNSDIKDLKYIYRLLKIYFESKQD